MYSVTLSDQASACRGTGTGDRCRRRAPACRARSRRPPPATAAPPPKGCSPGRRAWRRSRTARSTTLSASAESRSAQARPWPSCSSRARISAAAVGQHLLQELQHRAARLRRSGAVLGRDRVELGRQALVLDGAFRAERPVHDLPSTCAGIAARLARAAGARNWRDPSILAPSAPNV